MKIVYKFRSHLPERLEALYLSASERVERLTPSLLAKAFRVELVGQEQG